MEDFETIEKAKVYMNSLPNGEVKQTRLIDGSENSNEKICFESYTTSSVYHYTLEKHINYKLKISESHRNMMVAGAETGDLHMFIKHFEDTKDRRGHSLSRAIENGHWNIVEYLIQNYSLKDEAFNYATRCKQLQIMENLVNINKTLPNDWLTHGIYYDSFAVILVLLVSRNFDFDPKVDETYFLKVLRNKTDTAKLVKEFLLSMDFQSNETTQVNLKNWIEHKKRTNPNLINSWRTND